MKLIALIISWFLCPPLFLFLSIRWKKPKLIPRIILTTLAPLTLVVIFFIAWGSSDYYYYNIKRGSRSEIEAKTGLDFPNYKVIEKRHKTFGPSFNRDFSMEYSVRLDTTNISDFYQQLKTMSDTRVGENDERVAISWSTRGEDGYTFSHNDYQEHLFLEIDSNTGIMKITYGSL